MFAVGSETWRVAKASEGEASSATQRLRWAAVVAWDVTGRQPVKPAVRRPGRPTQRKVDDSPSCCPSSLLALELNNIKVGKFHIGDCQGDYSVEIPT